MEVKVTQATAKMLFPIICAQVSVEEDDFEVYQRPNGKWSWTYQGQESAMQHDHDWCCYRQIDRLLLGRVGKAEEYTDLASFLKRGKLGRGEEFAKLFADAHGLEAELRVDGSSFRMVVTENGPHKGEVYAIKFVGRGGNAKVQGFKLLE